MAESKVEPREAAEAEEKPVEEPKKARARRPKATKVAKPSAKAEEAEKGPALKPGQVHVYSLEGEAIRTVDLPPVFRSEVRLDLIRRAVTAFRANRRQTYGPSPKAGMRHSVRWSGKGQGVSRVPRIRGTMTGAQAPGTVGGRRAHPPRLQKIWAKKVNENERRLARNAALAALKELSFVQGRGHQFNAELSLPIVLEDRIEALEPEDGATRGAVQLLKVLGLLADVNRAKEGRHVRAGRGKMRGRRYRQPKSLLFVVKEPAKVRRAFGNLAGVEIVSPGALNAEVLAPGGDPGRLTVFSEGAIEVLRSWPA